MDAWPDLLAAMRVDKTTKDSLCQPAGGSKVC
jgi:hypothetical protein